MTNQNFKTLQIKNTVEKHGNKINKEKNPNTELTHIVLFSKTWKWLPHRSAVKSKSHSATVLESSFFFLKHGIILHTRNSLFALKNRNDKNILHNSLRKYKAHQKKEGRMKRGRDGRFYRHNITGLPSGAWPFWMPASLGSDCSAPNSSFLQTHTLWGNSWWFKYWGPCHPHRSSEQVPSSWFWPVLVPDICGLLEDLAVSVLSFIHSSLSLSRASYFFLRPSQT